MPRILVVDDTASIRLSLRRLLEGAGYEVIEASDGDDGVARAANGAPDLILMDMTMQRLDGIGAIRQIRRLPGAELLPIVAVSSIEERARWVEALEAGANDFVQKPYDPAELRARVSTHLKLALLTADLARKNRLLEHEKALARRVQENLLPGAIDFDGLVVETFYRASQGIGGDFYDAWESPGRVQFVVGDVSGHDTSAALLVAASRVTLRSIAARGLTPLEVVEGANRAMLELVGDSGLYLTLVLGSLERASGALELVSAGHNPVLLRRGGEVEPLESTGMPLGMFPGGVATWETLHRHLAPGDALLLFTDGVIDAGSPGGEPFGTSRLGQALMEWDPEATPPRPLAAPVAAAVQAFTGGPPEDDLTLLAIHRLRGPRPP